MLALFHIVDVTGVFESSYSAILAFFDKNWQSLVLLFCNAACGATGVLKRNKTKKTKTYGQVKVQNPIRRDFIIARVLADVRHHSLEGIR